MKRALRLALLGLGKTYPNPPVGAVVVKNGRIIGEGYYLAKEKFHAEVKALSDASVSYRGADLYVTLEPCSTVGRTGPCVFEIIKKGIRKVYVGARDPSAENGGRAKQIFLNNQIEYEKGICQQECDNLIGPFKTYCQKKRPWVTLKSAIGWDGRFSQGKGKIWLSGKQSIQSVHTLRSQVDAIVIGKNTLLQDDPQLTIRKRGFSQKIPLKIIFFSGEKISEDFCIFRHHPERTLLVTQKNLLTPHLKKLGVQQWLYESRESFLKKFMKKLYDQKIVHLLLEGGSGVYQSFLKEGLVDEFYLYLCPFLLFQGPCWLPENSFSSSHDHTTVPLYSLKTIHYQKLGKDILLRGLMDGRKDFSCLGV